VRGVDSDTLTNHILWGKQKLGDFKEKADKKSATRGRGGTRVWPKRSDQPNGTKRPRGGEGPSRCGPVRRGHPKKESNPGKNKSGEKLKRTPRRGETGVKLSRKKEYGW